MTIHTAQDDVMQELSVEELRAKVGLGMTISSEENMLLSMGPQHPSTHGVLRLLVELDGETVVNLANDIGFLHTGVEKSMESKTYTKALVSAVPEPDPDRQLDLSALMEGKASEPAHWPEPFTDTGASDGLVCMVFN